MKRSVNLNRARKSAGLNASNVADLMAHYGVTPDDLRQWAKKNAGTIHKTFVCPRCGKVAEAEVNQWDGSTTCPACENEIIIVLH